MNVQTPDPSSPAVSQYDTQQIAYATPGAPTGSRAWAAIAIVAAGVALVFLGGCFLLGILLTSTAATTSGPASSAMFAAVLYACCLFCFVAAGILLFFGTRALLRLLAH